MLFVLIFGYNLKRKVMNENGNNLIHSWNINEKGEGNYQGLTKREYFAGLAMQGLIQSGSFNLFSESTLISISEKSTKLADELLKQLEQ